MAQRTIASFFNAGAAPAPPAPLQDATNAPTRDDANDAAGRPTISTKKRFHPSDASPSRASKRVAAPRAFAKGADVVPIPGASRSDGSLELVSANGRHYLVNAESWDCANVTAKIAEWKQSDASASRSSSSSSSPAPPKFVAVKGTNGLIVSALASRGPTGDAATTLRCHRAPHISPSAPPLATMRLESSGGDVLRLASCAAASASDPNVLVVTAGGELKLLRVAEGEGEDGTGVTMTTCASVLLTEGTFKYALPESADGGGRFGACVMCRDDADADADVDADADADASSLAAAAAWTPVVAAVFSAATGTLCFIKITAAGATLQRTVNPHLGKAHAAAAWTSSSPGGAAVVSVGADGALAVTHLRADGPDTAWECVVRGGKSEAHAVAVDDVSGVAVTGSRDEDAICVWRLRDESRMRAVKLPPAGAGAAAAAAGGGGKGAEILRHFTLENVAIGAGGRLIAASNGNRDGGATLQLVRGR